MTMPHLMNCSHSGEGWCIPCVKEAHEKYQKNIVKFMFENEQKDETIANLEKELDSLNRRMANIRHLTY